MKFGVNSVLFGGFDLETAFKYTAIAGFEGIELSAIDGMSEHLVLSRWQEIAPRVRQFSREYDLALLAMEQPSQDPAVMEMAFQAADSLGIPVINCGPGGKWDDEGSLQQSIDNLGHLAERAEHFGIVLCTKAHVGASIYNTPTTLQVMKAIPTRGFGIDMDPSHIYRAGEDPTQALKTVISRVKHIHIRDCKGRQQGPGKPEDQANGRGDIDLSGFLQVLVENKYSGPVDLEVIGAKDYSLVQCGMIAAETRGHLRATMKGLL